MPKRQISIIIASLVYIQLDYVFGDWDRDFGDNSFRYNNGGQYNYGGQFNNYQPSHQSVSQSPPQTYFNTNPSTPPYPYYPYSLPTVISLGGNNNNNGKNNNKGNNGNNDFNMLDFLSLWIGSQNNNCPVYVPYPIPIPIPCMSDDEYHWSNVFNPEKWEENGWTPGSGFSSNPDPSSGGKRRRGRSKRRGKSSYKSNVQNSQSSSNTKNKQGSGKKQSKGNSSSGKKSSFKINPQSSGAIEYDDLQDSTTIHAGCNTITVSCQKPDKDSDSDYEYYADEEEHCNTSCDKKKVYRTQIVIKTS